MVEELVLDRQRSLALVRRALDAGSLAFEDVEIPDWVEDDLDTGESAPLCLAAAGNGFSYHLVLYTYDGYPDHRYDLWITREDGDDEMSVATMQLNIRVGASKTYVSSDWEYGEPMGKDRFDSRFCALRRFALRDKTPSDLEGGLAYIERVLATLSTVGTT